MARSRRRTNVEQFVLAVWTCRCGRRRTRPRPFGWRRSTAMATSDLLEYRGPALAGAWRPAEERLVDLDSHAGTAEQFTVGAHHRPAQLVHPRPRRLIRPEPRAPLQTQRRDPVLLRAHEPHRREPGPQRLATAMKDRARRHRGLAATRTAHPQAPARDPRVATAARRAHEPVRPTHPPRYSGTPPRR